MSPEILFWLALASKMAAAALFVLGATVAAERSGPLIGALIATLPLSAGPSYVFLAFDHDDAFIAKAALASIAINSATGVYALVYAKLAQRHSLPVCFTAGFSAWLATALLVQSRDWTLFEAIGLNAITYPVCIWFARDLRHAAMPRVALRWQDLVVRAAGVAVLMASVIILSFRIGPNATGVLAVFPLIFSSIMIILYRRVGGPAAAAVMAHSMPGLVGFGCCLVTLHLTAIPLGRATALLLALGVAVVWNVALFAASRVRRQAVDRV
jgi:energy-converting hydrogenase Eha subunit E